MALDAGALSRLRAFRDLLLVWNPRTRLVGGRDPRSIWERHIPDCLALAPLLPARGRVVDIGSGQGFPGIILGCVRPDLEIVLVEAKRRRVSFLRNVVRTVGLEHVQAFELRAEEAADDARVRGARMVTGRALRVETLLSLAGPLLAPRGRVACMHTLRAVPGATALGAGLGFRVAEVRPYVLPDDAKRAILVFEPA